MFGGGCFWCTEAIFQKLRGIRSVTPGYAGGTIPNPSYEQVCSGATGHAEVVEVLYDPAQISYQDLLTVFFATHDATTPDRQGQDVGAQYRSIILTTTAEQERAAKALIGQINRSSIEGGSAVTQIAPLTEFYPAEDDHKNYYAKHPDQAYCQLMIHPKLQKVQEKFRALVRKPTKIIR